MMASQIKDNLIEITCRNGEKSLAKVSQEKFEKIMKYSYKTCDQIAAARKEHEKQEKEWKEKISSPEYKKKEKKEAIIFLFVLLVGLPCITALFVLIVWLIYGAYYTI